MCDPVVTECFVFIGHDRKGFAGVAFHTALFCATVVSQKIVLSHVPAFSAVLPTNYSNIFSLNTQIPVTLTKLPII